jgi:hypothetical protein
MVLCHGQKAVVFLQSALLHTGNICVCGFCRKSGGKQYRQCCQYGCSAAKMLHAALLLFLRQVLPACFILYFLFI